MIKEIYYKNVQIILVEDERENNWGAAFHFDGIERKFSNWPDEESLIRHIHKTINEHMGLTLSAVTPGSDCIICGKLGNFVILGKHLCASCVKTIKEG